MDENLIKISELSEKVTLDGSEYFPIQDGSTTKKAKTSNFATSADLDKKVDKEDGKVLSTNDFTDEDKSKLDGINTEELLTKTEASTTYQTAGDYVTTEVADEKYQTKGDYITEIPSDVVRLSENKNIILPVDGSVTMIQEVESGSGGVVLCQRNYGEGNVTELGNSRNKLTLNATERPQVDLSSGKKENLAFSSDLETLATKEELGNKVDKEEGKVLSTNDFTNEYKSKLDGINTEELLTKTEASSTYQAKGDYITSEEIGTSPAIEDIKSNYATKSEISNKIAGDGVTSIKVVTELPGVQESNVLYIVIPQE